MQIQNTIVALKKHVQYDIEKVKNKQRNCIN